MVAEEKKVYYKLDIDSFGQPSGTYTPIRLTKKEYEQRRKYEWIFDNEAGAIYRSLD